MLKPAYVEEKVMTKEIWKEYYEEHKYLNLVNRRNLNSSHPILEKQRFTKDLQSHTVSIALPSFLKSTPISLTPQLAL